MNSQIYNVPNDAKERGDRLKRLRNLANLPRKILCEEADLNINTYIGYEVGKYGGLTKKGAEKIIQYLSIKGVYCSFDWLMNGFGKSPYVITDFAEQNSDHSEKKNINEELHIFCKHYTNSIHCEIIDDGMLPIYEVGSIVAGIALHKQAIHKVLGLDCIVQTLDGELMVRNLRKGRINNTYTLTCINPQTIIPQPILYDVHISYAAKIIWHRKIYNDD